MFVINENLYLCIYKQEHIVLWLIGTCIDVLVIKDILCCVYENLYLCVCNQGHIVSVIYSMLYFYVCHQEHIVVVVNKALYMCASK